MNIRPFREIRRRKTKTINVGNVKIGGENPILVQTMINTLTSDPISTIKQIHKIQKVGADIVRVSCPDKESTSALKIIKKEIEIPLVADIHFHYQRAIEAAENRQIVYKLIAILEMKKRLRMLSVLQLQIIALFGVNAGLLEKIS